MYDNEIIHGIDAGINDFLMNDSYLIINNLNERTITHRLAISISKYFENFDVDCEYNGNIVGEGGKKRIKLLKEELAIRNLLTRHENELESEIIERSVFPDIIIHKRGTRDNLCIIEVKKSNSKVDFEYDHLKLSMYTRPDFGNTLNYQLGIFIEFIISDYPSFELSYFKDGEQFNNVQKL